MAKFYGDVGFGLAVNKGVGVHEIDMQVRKYYGDELKNSRALDTGDSVNGKIRLNNSISIMATPFAYENADAIRYVVIRGVPWEVTTVTEERPRLILRLGGKYSGKLAS